MLTEFHGNRLGIDSNQHREPTHIGYILKKDSIGIIIVILDIDHAKPYILANIYWQQRSLFILP